MADPNGHSLVGYNDNTILAQLYRLFSGLYEEFMEILYSFLTKKGRLERALETKSISHAAYMRILEKALGDRRSGYTRISEGMGDETEVDTVLREEKIQAQGKRRDDMKATLEIALKRISAIDELAQKVESLRMQSFDSSNPSHVQLLTRLWTLLRPNEELEGLISKQWRDIGFQGNNPSTDFRGMGILSLHQLVFFAENEPELVDNIMSLCNHPAIGFPFAVAGITFTSLTRALLQADLLNSHFYNTRSESVTIDDFHYAYVRIFALFSDYFKRSNPPSVMHFNVVRTQFELSLSSILQREDADLHAITIDHL